MNTTTAIDSAVPFDPQTDPVLLRDELGILHDGLMIDQVTWTKSELIIQGWIVGGGRLSILRNGKPVETTLTPHARPDVAEIFGLNADELGFTVTGQNVRRGEIELLWETSGLRHYYRAPLRAAYPASQRSQQIPKGFLETAGLIPVSGGIVVSGWAMAQADELWLETDDGECIYLNEAFRYYRHDVFNAVGCTMAEGSPKPGFTVAAHVQGSPTHIRMVTQVGGDEKVIAEIALTTLQSGPLQAFQWMAGLLTQSYQLAERLEKVELPLITRLLSLEQQAWDHLPVTVREFGPAHQHPSISLIIPLYGRYDFIENQLLEFAKDAWLREHAQIIYVIDDPKLVDGLFMSAENLYKQYQVPYTLVWGLVNRGFSGANNLGRKFARAENLIFMNSDCFPQEAGWATTLSNVLTENPDIGIVAPRLVFFNGSIQHNSMTFVRRDDLGIWINHHPCMGLDPVLDPYKYPTATPAVTGACMAIRAKDLDSVGGWDTGYLVGDFEDSDLCLKITTKGLKVVYDPRVELTHLERQSFKLLGDGKLRSRITILNGIRHQIRWAQLISSL